MNKDSKDILKISKDGKEVLGVYDEFITSIVIPDGIETIKQHAFRDCKLLHEANLPQSIKRIEVAAFSGCKCLNIINLPEQLSEIENCLFSDCEKLESIIIPHSVKKIGDYAFSNCKSLKKIVIPNSVISFGSFAFGECISLSEIEFEDGLQKVEGCGVFSGCSSIKSLCFPDSLKIIDGVCLSDFTKLNKIKLSKTNNNYKFIDGALYSFDLKKLIRVMPNKKGVFEVPKGVKEIDHCALNDCKHLNKVIIPDSVRVIGRFAFEDCKSLTEIVLPEKLKALDRGIFKGCKSLSKINLPNSIRKIEWLCFFGCESMTELYLPDSLTSIGSNVFPSKLQNLYIGAGNAHFTVVDGVLYNKEITELITMPKNHVNRKLIIPDTVKKIRYDAFRCCGKLRSIELPDGLIDIGDSAFEHCSSLKSISLPNGIKKISKDTFRGCKKLLKVKFPSKLKIIEDNAFDGCDYLQFIKLPGTLRSIGSLIFPKQLMEISFSNSNPKRNDILMLYNMCMYNEWAVEVNIPIGSQDKYEKYGLFGNFYIGEIDLERCDYMKEPGMIAYKIMVANNKCKL